MPRRPDPILVLGILGQYPMAGVSWQAIHYVLGLRQLGWDVFYVEDSGAPPYDPRLGMATEDCSHAVAYVADVMRQIGLPDRWAYVDLMHGETHGLPRARLDTLYREKFLYGEALVTTEGGGQAAVAAPFITALAGFILGRLGRLAQVGDSVVADGVRLKVEALDGRRIARVSLTPAAPARRPQADPARE